MEETISLKEIFEVLKKRIVLIVSLIVVAAVIAAAVSYFVLTPKYESSSQFIVNQSNDNKEMQDYNASDITKNADLVNTYNVIIKSPAILDQVIDKLHLSTNASELEDKLDISSEEDSQVVTVSATDTDPKMAMTIANTTVKIFQKEIPDLMSVDNVKVLSEAKLKDDPTPISPRKTLNVAIAIVLGAMVGVGLAFLLEYLDNTIKTEDDIEKKLGVPILGIISHIDEKDVQVDKSGLVSSRQKMNQGGYHNGTQKRTI